MVWGYYNFGRGGDYGENGKEILCLVLGARANRYFVSPLACACGIVRALMDISFPHSHAHANLGLISGLLWKQKDEKDFLFLFSCFGLPLSFKDRVWHLHDGFSSSFSLKKTLFGSIIFLFVYSSVSLSFSLVLFLSLLFILAINDKYCFDIKYISLCQKRGFKFWINLQIYNVWLKYNKSYFVLY